MPKNPGWILNPVELFRQGWDILRTVYWFNSIPWRLLKSVALLMFGFFCLAGANLLYSYKPDWGWLYWIMSYGLLLIIYGPIHHLIVIPVSLRLNHYEWGRKGKLGKRIPFWTLTAFFVAVPIFGQYPLDVMTFEFQSTNIHQRPDINPELQCELDSEAEPILIKCDLTESRGIAKVEVQSNNQVITTTEKPPFTVQFPLKKVREVVGQKQFQVVLFDSNGRMIRRFVRTQTMIQ